MKMRIAVIMLLLCCLCARALGAFDLSAYEFDAEYAVPVGRGQILTMEREGEKIRAEIRCYDRVMMSRAYDFEDRDPIPHVLADGRLSFVTMRYGDGYSFRMMNDDGSLQEEMYIGKLRRMVPHQQGIAAIDDQRNALMVFDRRSAKLFEEVFPDEMQPDLLACSVCANGDFLIALSLGLERIAVQRRDAQGQLIWEAELEEEFPYNWEILCDNGQGGAFFVFPDWDNYKLAQVHHIGADGSVQWKRLLEAEGLIFSSYEGMYDQYADRMRIAGHAVSRSKGVYDVVTLAVDREGNLSGIEAKDFSCRPDYSFSVHMTHDGAVYAASRANYLDTLGTPAVLVPMEALPDIEPPVMSLR